MRLSLLSYIGGLVTSRVDLVFEFRLNAAMQKAPLVQTGQQHAVQKWTVRL